MPGQSWRALPPPDRRGDQQARQRAAGAGQIQLESRRWIIPLLVGLSTAEGGPAHEGQRSLGFGRRLRRSLLSRLVRKPTPGRGLRSFGTQRATSSYSASSRTNDGGVCYLETHDTDRFAGHFRLRLIEFTPIRLAFEIDRPEDRTVEVIYKLSTQRFREVQHIVHIIFGVEP